ncbi:MAG: hypothetical protein N2Z85_00215 [Patescibacteria group bacterium]|nr:hypothetical protein [Patescibacteria group bacterium]
MNFKNRRGQALVESIIALSVLTLGFLSLIGLLNNSIGLTKVANENYVATYLASEGIEIVKNIIDNNRLQKIAWNSGLNNGDYEVEYSSLSLQPYQNRFLKFDNQNGVYNYSNGTNTIFKRKINIQNLVDAIKVTSIVSWTSRGEAQYNIQLEDVFYNSL